MPTQTGPRLRIEGSCEGCAWHAVLVPGERRCTEPSAQRKIARSVGAKAPAWCPELPAARLALARSMVAAADDVLCSKCGKPVSTADEKSYRMHSMAGCPR